MEKDYRVINRFPDEFISGHLQQPNKQFFDTEFCSLGRHRCGQSTHQKSLRSVNTSWNTKPKYPLQKWINYRTEKSILGRQGPNSVAKQQNVAKPAEHVTTIYACVMVKIGIFIAFIDWQVQLDKRDLLNNHYFRTPFIFKYVYKLVNASAVALVLLKRYKRLLYDL